MSDNQQQSSDGRYSPWRQNHGNFLVAFVVLILLCGSGILIYKQLQFEPPGFPGGGVIENEEPTPSGFPDDVDQTS